MSEKALALIFINLGGEMLYVLDQRLFAQKINREKGNKSKQPHFQKIQVLLYKN